MYWLHELKSLLLKKLLQAQLIVSFCQTPWKENVSWWMAHMKYLLLFMSRLRCDILLSTCRRKNPWCQRQNICQCHEKLCFGQRKGIFILLQKNYFEQSRINGNLKIDQNKLSSQFSLHFSNLNQYSMKKLLYKERVHGN